MFRDLKEYQEIAKIYADKVSKPEELDERVRGGGMSGSIKPFKKPVPSQGGAGGGVGNPTNVRGIGAKPRPETDASGKVIPSTAEIRAKAAAKRGGTPAIGGGNAGASTDSGGTSKSTIKSVPVEKEVSTITKQGKPRTKAQMMAAKRIASGKTISDVKAENQASMKSKAAERFAAFKAKRSGKTGEETPVQKKPAPTPSGDKLKAGSFGISKKGKEQAAMNKGEVAAKKTNIPSGDKLKAGSFGISDKGKAEALKNRKDRTVPKGSFNITKEDYEPYDLVLEYLLSSEQVATIEEANYVMTEMDEKTIQSIVDEGLASMALKTGAAIGGALLAKKGLGDMKKKFDNFLNNKRNNSKFGGNKRVDDTRQGSGDKKVGEKIKFGK